MYVELVHLALDLVPTACSFFRKGSARDELIFSGESLSEVGDIFRLLLWTDLLGLPVDQVPSYLGV